MTTTNRRTASTATSARGGDGTIVATCTRAEPSARMSKPRADAITLDVTAGVLGDIHSGRGKRQVAIVAMETLDALAAQVGRPIEPGAMGENLVVEGIPVAGLVPGATLEFASGARIEVTMPRKPCVELEEIAPGLLRAAVGNCGVFARVTRGGQVAAGQGCRLLAVTLIS